MNLVADVAAPSAAWAAWNLAVAVAVPRMPAYCWSRPDRRSPHPPRRPNPLAVRRWKHLLPDAGAWLPGGSSKRHLPSRDRTALRHHADALRCGEIVHWASLLTAPVLAWWWPVVVVAPITVLAIVLNVPCIVVLRFNRERLQRALLRPPHADVAPSRPTRRPQGRVVATESKPSQLPVVRHEHVEGER